jgi:murein DD-endopeptidase MepM/ murein hydrolase activator NlpD
MERTNSEIVPTANPCDNAPNWPSAPAPTKNPLTKMEWATGLLKDKFGCTRSGNGKFHAGIDIKAAVGTPCFAVEDAKVETIGYGKDVGSYVTISFKKDEKTYGVAYCHLSMRTVKEGAMVKAGEKLGETGISGNADPDNPHLHLEIQDQVWVGYADAEERSRHGVNPNSYLDRV